MNELVLKQVSAVMFMLYFVYWIKGSVFRQAWIGGAFFFSYLAFSQNFSFYFRELHQILLIFLILHGALNFNSRTRFYWFDITLAAVAGFIFFSLAFNEIDADARIQTLNFFIAALVAHRLLVLTVENPKGMDSAFALLANLTVGVAFVGGVESILGISPRSEATLSNPNYYAHALGVGFCITWTSIKDRFKILKLVVIFFGILVSGSRSAILIPLIQILWSSYISGGFHRLAKYAVPTAMFVLLLLFSGVTRYSASEESQASDAERFVFASIAYRMAVDRPISGVGWGRFVSEFSNYSSAAEEVVIDSGVIDVSDQDRRVTHNDFLRILAELGWGGFVVSIFFVGYMFLKILRFRKKFPHYIFPIWVGTLLFSLTHNNMNSAFFWYLILLPQVWDTILKSGSSEVRLGVKGARL